MTSGALARCVLGALLLLCLVDVRPAKRIASDKVYLNLFSENICFRRFNRTHQTGCQSSAGGNVGTIQLIQSEQDLDLVVSKGKHQPYIPCLYVSDFTVENLQLFQSSGRVSGVLLFHPDGATRPAGFSADSPCPGDEHGLYPKTAYAGCAKQRWNSVAGPLSLMSLDLQFPVFLIRDAQNITEIEQCYRRFNHRLDADAGTKCSAQLEARMTGAKDSVTCISRTNMDAGSIAGGVRFCDPLGSLNLFASLFEQPADVRNRSTLMVSARLDSLSFFDGAAKGADSTLTALITLLSLVDTMRGQRQRLLVDTLKDGATRDNVLFSLFDGEAFDYIGSGRAAYDMSTKGLKHLNLFKGQEKYTSPLYRREHFNAILELNQLALHGTDRLYYLHSDPLSLANVKLAEGINKMKEVLKYENQSSPISIRDAPVELPLPPSSVQSFLRDDFEVPSLVLSNHEKEFTNPFYNGFLDDDQNVAYSQDKPRFVRYVSELSRVLSKALLKMLNDPADVEPVVDSELISEMAECFFVDINCTLFTRMRGAPTQLPLDHMRHYPLYVAVAYPSLSHYHFEYVRTVDRLLAYVNGDRLSDVVSRPDCDLLREKFNYTTFEWFDAFTNESIAANATGQCLRTSRFASLAVSPVFADPEQPDWSLTKYSTWTESVWVTPSARIFVAPTQTTQYATLATGLSLFLLSYAIVSLLNRKAELVFLDLRISNNVTVTGC